MSDALVILDSDDEEDLLGKSQRQLSDDEPLFEESAPNKTLFKKPESKKRDSDDFNSFLDTLNSSSTQKDTAEISDEDEEMDSSYPNDHFEKEQSTRKKNTSQYAKFLQDSSPESSPPPPSSSKNQKKRSLKNPTTSKKNQEEREDLMEAFIDDSEEIIQQDKRENSIDILIEESHSLLTAQAGRKRRSLKNPILNKRKDSLDELLTSTSSKTKDAYMDDIDDSFSMPEGRNKSSSNSTKKRKNSVGDLLVDHDDLSDDISSIVTWKGKERDVLGEKKAKLQDSFEFEGDFMGRDKSLVSRQNQERLPYLNKKPPESIDLLSDEDSDDQAKEDTYLSTSKKKIDKAPSLTSDISYDDDKPKKYKPSSRLKVDESKTDRPRKSSIDRLLDDDDDLIVTSPPSSSLPRSSSSSPKAMPSRPRQKISFQKLLYKPDSSPELSPTLQPKKVVKKRKRPLSNPTSPELSDSDLNNSSTFKTNPSLSKDKSSNNKPIPTFNIDDSDDDNLREKSAENLNDSNDDDDILDTTRDNNSDDEMGLDSDSFFDDLLSLQKKRKPNSVTKKKNNPLESIASSSKSTNVYMDFEDDEPIITDRKGKQRADAIGPPRKRKNSVDDIFDGSSQLDEDTLTPKEKRQLQSEKKKEEAQRKREEKNRLREEKKLEKERQVLYEKANKIKNNRNDILKEIIMDIHPRFLLTKSGQIIQQVMESKETEIFPLNDECCQTISWRRKCSAEWDTDSQSFHPLVQTKLIEEPIVLLFYEVNQFIQHIIDDTLDNIIKKVKISCSGKQVIMMIEGLEIYYKKKKLSESRQFQQAVRQSINDDNDTSNAAANGRKKKKTATIYEAGPKKEEVEKVLVQLQMVNDIMLIATKSDDDSASWLESLTIDLALGRYKTKNLNNTYRVTRTGKGPSDTFSKMLQEVHLCTPAVARSIMSSYPSAQSLYQAYQKTSRGSVLLADLEVERSTVQVRDRTINKVMSKKIHSIFTCTDPEYVIF